MNQEQQHSSKKRFILLSLGLVLLVAIPLILSSQNVRKQASQYTISPTPPPEEKIVAGEVVVKFKPSLPQEEIQSRLATYNATIKKPTNKIGITVLTVPPGEETTIINKLITDGLVEYAEPNYILEPRFTPNDPDLAKQYALTKVQAQQAWDVTRGQGVKVAILDSGIDLNHPDLASKVVAQQNFVGGSSVQDTQKHGTHTAGIAAAITNNGVGIASICPDCELIIAKTDFKAAEGAEAAIWATDQGAKVISMSWGGSKLSKALQDALAYAWSKGVLPVAAVQNKNINDKIDYPSSFTTVMSVTNTDSADKKVTAAGYGTWVWIAAPGKSIHSTIPDGYGSITGTSMSTPLVAGVAALVWSTQYGTSPEAVRQRLCDTADKITGTGTQFKCGRLNAFKAVGGTSATPATSTAPTNTSPGAQPSSRISTAPTRPGSSPAPLPTSTIQPTQAIPTIVIEPSPTMYFPTPTFVCLGPECSSVTVSSNSQSRLSQDGLLHALLTLFNKYLGE